MLEVVRLRQVCIDPGHGGHDPGAVGPSGTREADVALFAASALLLALDARGVQSFVTRGRNVFVSLPDRVEMAKNMKAIVFVSIHANGVSNPQANGAEVWTSPGVTPADDLATSIYKRWIESFGTISPVSRFRTDFSDGDPDKEAGFWVLKKTPMPAVLFELGFVTNPREEKMLQSEGFIKPATGAIAAGICDWLGRQSCPGT